MTLLLYITTYVGKNNHYFHTENHPTPKNNNYILVTLFRERLFNVTLVIIV